MKVQKQIQAINEPFFTADGSSDLAQLLVAGSPMFEPSNVFISAIWQTDWQGTLLLSLLARTNLSANSQTIAGTGWTNIAATIDTTTALAPDGTNTATTFHPTTSGTTCYTITAIQTVLANTVETRGIFLKAGTATASDTAVYNSTVATLIAHQVVNWSGGVPSLGNSSGVIAGSASLTSLGAGWYYLQYSYNTGSFTGIRNLCYPDAKNTVGTTTFWGDQTVDVPGIYIPTAGAAVTQTDYTYDGDEVTFGYTPIVGASFTWSGTADIEVLDATATLLAQYANSPAIVALVDYMNQWIDPSAQLDQFYDLIWNVETAQGIGLDIWGTIVDIPRTIQLVPPDEYFGFETSIVSSFYPFNSRPFYAGPQQGTQYTLSDDAYRVLIMTKALANISSFTAPSLNALFRYLFAGRGSCYALDLGGMQMQYVFNFALQPWEASVLQQPQLMPRPAGVGVTITVNP